MLHCVSSRELTQWMAYETVNGPVGPWYEQMALRQIVDLLRDGKDANKDPYPSPPDWLLKMRSMEAESGNWEDIET